MGVEPGHKGLAVFIRLRQPAFHVPGGKTDHPAEDRHGGSKIGTVSLPGIQQEGRDEIDVFRVRRHVQRIAVTADQPGLERQRLVIGRSGDGGGLPRQGVDRFLQMARKGRVGFGHLVIPAVLQRGTDFDERAETGIAGRKEGSGNAVGIPGPQVSRDEQFRGIGKVRDQVPAGRDLPDALRHIQGRGAVAEHTYGNGDRIAEGISDIQGRKVFVEQGSPQLSQPWRLPQVTPPAGGIDPVPPGVPVKDHAAQIDGTGRGNLHDDAVAGIRLAAELILAFGIIPFRGKGKDVAGLCEEQPVKDGLAQLVRLLPERVGPYAASGCQERAGHRQRREGDQRQRRRFREPVGQEHQKQGGQCRQEPGNDFPGT